MRNCSVPGLGKRAFNNLEWWRITLLALKTKQQRSVHIMTIETGEMRINVRCWCCCCRARRRIVMGSMTWMTTDSSIVELEWSCWEMIDGDDLMFNEFDCSKCAKKFANWVHTRYHDRVCTVFRRPLFPTRVSLTNCSRCKRALVARYEAPALLRLTRATILLSGITLQYSE